ncbi:MAG TPA: HAD hydrolase family protein [Pyrinomonadaceae bacterium]|nr:HAD hydrolase family protein [Pyrinomonadaceae bacterium]
MDQLELRQRAARVKLLLMDCDGVLTDGRIWILENGEDQKAFHTRDGLGIDLLHRAGLKSGIISGRTSSALERRAQSLGVSYLWQGRDDKRQAFADTLAQADVTKEEVAYVGDDLTDLPLMVQSGFAIAVGDAVAEVKDRAHYVTAATGGNGAVREVIELILKAQGRWDELVKWYLI